MGPSVLSRWNLSVTTVCAIRQCGELLDFTPLVQSCMVTASAVEVRRTVARCEWEGQIDLGSMGGAVRVGGVVQLVHPALTVLLGKAHVPPQPPCPRPFKP